MLLFWASFIFSAAPREYHTVASRQTRLRHLQCQDTHDQHALSDLAPTSLGSGLIFTIYTLIKWLLHTADPKPGGALFNGLNSPDT